jgi:hypothetical protein
MENDTLSDWLTSFLASVSITKQRLVRDHQNEGGKRALQHSIAARFICVSKQ